MKRKANGDGCIAKRNDGRYQSSIQVNGVRKTFYGHTENEVKKKLKEYQAKSLLGIEDDDSSYTFDEYVTYWLNNVKKIEVKPGSYDRLLRTYDNYLKIPLGKKRLKDIKTKELQNLIFNYTQQYSFSTVKKIHGMLKASLTYAVKARDIRYNPMDAVAMPRESACGKKTKEIVIPKDEDIRKFFIEARRQYGNEGYVYNQNYVDAFELIENTGLRIGELLALSNDHIDLDKSEIDIAYSISEVVDREDNDRHYRRIITEPKTKNGKRKLFINEKASNSIKRIQERNGNIIPNDSLILNSKGKPASCHDMERTLKRICEKSGIKSFGLHTLRHYFASKFLAHGGDAFILSKYLGHSNPSITLRIYAHLTEEHKDELERVISQI